jgi:hypothetical protein
MIFETGPLMLPCLPGQAFCRKKLELLALSGGHTQVSMNLDVGNANVFEPDPRGVRTKQVENKLETGIGLLEMESRVNPPY